MHLRMTHSVVCLFDCLSLSFFDDCFATMDMKFRIPIYYMNISRQNTSTNKQL